MRPLFILLLSLLACQVRADGPGAAEYRDFTSQSGKTVRARLMKVEDGQAVLRFSSGKETPVPIEALSVDDQAYIQNWDPRERIRAAAKKSGGDTGLAQVMAGKNYTVVPLEQKGKSVLVDVGISGKTYKFVFDTGRALSMIDKAIADSMGATTDLDIGEIPTIDGAIEKVWIATMPFKVGEVEIPVFEPGAVPMKKIGIDAEGILGADLMQYCNGVVDWKSMKVYLSKNP